MKNCGRKLFPSFEPTPRFFIPGRNNTDNHRIQQEKKIVQENAQAKIFIAKNTGYWSLNQFAAGILI
jgi:hypothetical protein